MGYRIAVVVATYNRPSELAGLLDSLTECDVELEKVIISDASSRENFLKNKKTIEKYSQKLTIGHVLSERPSLTYQKNLAIGRLDLDALDYVQILDDDTRPARDYLSRLARLLTERTDAVGASGVTSQHPTTWSFEKRLNQLMYVLGGLESYKPGRVTLSGCGMAARSDISYVQETEWIFGCSLWRAWVFKQMLYDSSLKGSAQSEDTEFSNRALRLGKLLVDPLARLDHSMSTENRPPDDLFAYRFSRNRWLVSSNQRPRWLAGISYFRSIVFLMSLNFILGLLGRKESGFSLAKATARGAFDALLGKDPI